MNAQALYRTKTFWGGIVAVLAAVVGAVFADEDTLAGPIEALKALQADARFWVGLLAIFGRHALVRR